VRRIGSWRTAYQDPPRCLRSLLDGQLQRIGAYLKKFLFGIGRVSGPLHESAKPGFYARVRHIVQARSLPLALFRVGVLALPVNLVKLLCTVGLPALYTAVLSQEGAISGSALRLPWAVHP
jgi:hypothetical protein